MTKSIELTIVPEDIKGIVAVDRATGNQYVIGTRKVLNCYGDEIEEFLYMNFMIDSMTMFEGRFRFRVTRGNELIGDQDTLRLVFNIA